VIQFVQGNLFDRPVDIRVNTVNCVGVMGKGVALAFKKRYPAMFVDYRAACEQGLVRPGTLHIWRCEADWIINFPTKVDWRYPSEYAYIDRGLLALRNYLQKQGAVSVALPPLGCGNGGLEWSQVSKFIEHHLRGLEATIYVYEPHELSHSEKSGRDC
jgi:O-acetyl-ADP-ribose deacetylase (regulator of RNase III)